MKNVFAVLALLLATVGVASAQAPSATLVGRVTDKTKAIIPGATVVVRNLDTNAIRTATTDKQGEYTLTNLDPGKYDITVSMEKFKEAYEPLVELESEQSSRFDVTLQVGSIKEEVVVTTEVGALHTENGEKGDNITAIEISEMPLDGRDFQSLVFNVAGVAPAEEGTKGSEFVTNGVRSDQTNFVVDGVNNTNPRDSTPESAPPLDSLQEFKVQTSNYSAEYGRVAGPVINLVVKKGGNVVHGSIFEYVRNNAFDTHNYFDVPNTQSELRRNQFGGTIGGPVYIPHIYNGHNKTFFLLSEESYRQVAGSNKIGIVPTQAERNGDFSQSYNTFTGQLFSATPTIPLYNPATGGVLSNYQLPPNQQNPVAIQLTNQFFPLPNGNQYVLPGTNNYIVNAKGYDYWDNIVLKIDQQLARHDEASIKYLGRHEHKTNPFSGQDIPLWGSVTHNLQTILQVTETHIFNPRLINDFRSGLTRNVNTEKPFDLGTNWAAQLGIPGTTTDPTLEDFPGFSITGYDGLGDSTQEPIAYTSNNYDTLDTMTLNKGRHTVKWGFDMLRQQYFQPTNSEFSGNFGFSGRATITSGSAKTVTATAQNGYLEFLAGYNSSSDLRVGTVTNHLFNTSYSGFAQDDYKVSAGVTLNVGMRYEIDQLPYEENNLVTNYVPSLQLAILAAPETAALDATIAGAGATGAVGYAAQYGLPRGLVYNNHNRLAPRFGFAWRPSLNDQLVIRGGYGIFYTGSRTTVFRTQLSGQFPYSTVLTCSSGAFVTSFVGCNKAKFSSVYGWDLHPASGYVQSWNMTMERELPKGFAVEVAYTGSKGTHLGRQIDINQKNPFLGLPRPYPFYTSINMFQFTGYSNDNAGTVTLRKRYEHGLMMRANFTWARALDVASALNYAGAGGYNGVQDSSHPNAEYGRSDFDRKFVFNGNFVYNLPFRRNFFVKGWETAGSFQIDSGLPFTPQYSGPSADSGLATLPDRICNGASSSPNVNNWFNEACFVQPAGFFGNSGRNIITGPKLVTINMSLLRNFRLTDKTKLQFRAEVFNVPNHPNFNTPNDALDQSNVGTITTAKDPRTIQLGAKFEF